MKDNKKTKLRLSAIDGQTYNPTLAVEKNVRGGDYISWGVRNNYPDYLFDTVNNCATLGSIINGSVTYTMGNGIVNHSAIPEENRFGEQLEDVINKTVVDRWIFGGFAVQVLFNKLGQVTELCYIDFRRLRTNREGTVIYVYDDWSGWGTNRHKTFNAFNPETGAKDGIQIFYYKGSKTRGVYPVPDYAAALVSAEIQIQIQKFNYNELINNFIGSAIINFNNGEPTQDEKDYIEKMVNNKFAGSDNTARILLTFNEDKEKAVTVDRLQGDDLDERYRTLAESTRENLFVSLGALPILFAIQDKTGFNKQEYKDAFALYNSTRIVPVQTEISRVYNRILKGAYPEGGNAFDFSMFNIEFTD